MTSVPTRGRRHPMSVVTKARRLAEGGWNRAEIQRLLAAEGVTVQQNTIARWTDPGSHGTWERLNEVKIARRAAVSGTKPMGYPHARPEFKLARLRALHEAGLNQTSLATVMRFDFGDVLSRHQVEYALKHGVYPKRVGISRLSTVKEASSGR